MNESIHYLNPPGDMTFANRLATTRKYRGLTQQALASTIGVHVTQLRRYEAGTSQPTLDVLRALARALPAPSTTSPSTTTNAAPPPPTCASNSKPSTG